MLYRVAELADWQQAQQTGFFASADLQAEGFIHTSERHQLIATANRYYRGRADVVLLEINEEALQAAGVEVKREWVGNRQQHFAHVYGPIPAATIRRVWPFAAGAAGEFRLPDDL
jgi:uncharacterized protein (DUF952 family)